MPVTSSTRAAHAGLAPPAGFLRTAFALATALLVFVFGAFVLLVGVLLMLWMRIGQAIGGAGNGRRAEADEDRGASEADVQPAPDAQAGDPGVRPGELERFRGSLDEYLRARRGRD